MSADGQEPGATLDPSKVGVIEHGDALLTEEASHAQFKTPDSVAATEVSTAEKSLAEQLGEAIAGKFRKYHEIPRLEGQVWDDEGRAGWEGLTLAAQRPVSDVIRLETYGFEELIAQPTGGDGSSWVYNNHEYNTSYVDGLGRPREGNSTNTRLEMKDGELTYFYKRSEGYKTPTEKGVKYSSATTDEKMLVDLAMGRVMERVK